MRRMGNSPVPPTAALCLLQKEERARLLLLIAKAIRAGRKVQSGDRRYCRTLTDAWPGMDGSNEHSADD